MKKCCACKIEKPNEEFGNNKKNSDGKQTYCRDCGKARDKLHYEKNENRRKYISENRRAVALRNKIFVINYLLSHPCVDCGECDPIFLEFDHNEKKINSIAEMSHRGRSIEILSREIDKCEIRCVKCHRIKTAKQMGWFEEYFKLVEMIKAKRGSIPVGDFTK